MTGISRKTPEAGILAEMLLARILPSSSSAPVPHLAQGSGHAHIPAVSSSHLDLHLVPLLRLLHLAVLVTQLGFLLLQLPAGDLP